VVYDNTLDDRTDKYGAVSDNGYWSTGLGAAAGVQMTSGTYNIVIDDNTIENVNKGIWIWGGPPEYFIQATNNQIDNVNTQGILLDPETVSGTLGLIGVVARDNAIEWNSASEFSNAVTVNEDGNWVRNADDTFVPTGIEIGGQVPSLTQITNGQWTVGSTAATLSVVEQNQITTDISGSTALGLGVMDDPDVFISDNTLQAGDDPDTTVPAVAFCDLENDMGQPIGDPQALMANNTYENYDTVYVDAEFEGSQNSTVTYVSLPASLLQTPVYVLSASVPSGQPVEFNLPILADGPSSLDWSIESTAAPITFQPSSGSISAEVSAESAVLIDTAELTTGTYAYTLTVSDGTREQDISVWLTIM